MLKRILLFSAFLLLLTACTVTPDGNPTVPISTDPSSSPLPSITPSPTPSETVLNIGSTEQLGDWSITVDSFEIVDKIDNTYGSFSPDESNLYVVVHVTTKNNGKEAGTFLPSFALSSDLSAKIMYQGEYEYSSSNLLGYDADLHDKHLNPLASATGVIAFSIVEEVVNSSDLTVVFTLDKSKLEYELK